MLFKASREGVVQQVKQYNNLNYQSKTGTTALHEAIAAGQLDVIVEIDRSRPALKGLSDNVS